MIGFLGEYEATLDSKGRFLLPTGIRKQLPESTIQFVINRGFEKCLSLYILPTWEPIFDKIMQLNAFESKVREFKRYFLNGATMIELDSAGRLLVPPNLKDHAGLGKDLVVASVGEIIEIWDKSKYKEFFENVLPNQYSAIAEEVMGTGKKNIQN